MLASADWWALVRNVIGARPTALLRRTGLNPSELRRQSRLEIEAVVGERATSRLLAALELGARSLTEPLDRGVSLKDADAVERCLRAEVSDLEQEELHVIGVDTLNRMVIHSLVAKGRLNQLYAYPRDVFRPLVRAAAHASILVHNHPSGSCAPSESDATLTDRLAHAGSLVGIPLLDHIILGRGGRYSFAEAGRLP